MCAQGWAEAEKAKAQRKPAAMREHEQIFGQAPRWPDRHGSCSAWSQGIKQVQFAWFSGQLGLIVNLASTHRATWDAMTPSFAGFLVHR